MPQRRVRALAVIVSEILIGAALGEGEVAALEGGASELLSAQRTVHGDLRDGRVFFNTPTLSRSRIFIENSAPKQGGNLPISTAEKQWPYHRERNAF